MFTDKSEMLQTLRQMLREVLELRSRGAAYARLARAHGYIDGYMRGLMEGGFATHAELLAIVAEVRAEMDGPAVGELGAIDGGETKANATVAA
jgi:hypothetical protein